MDGDKIDSSPLIPPTPTTGPSEIDLEEGRDGKIQCQICLKTGGWDFIAPCKCEGTPKYVHRRCLDHWRSLKFYKRMGGDKIDASPLMAPAPITGPSYIDLEEGSDGKIGCQICLETDGWDFTAPFKYKGTSKYVHRRRLDHWRSVKFSKKMGGDKIDSSLLMAPASITGPSEIDLEEGSDGKIQCRFCLETDAPCKCKGTSKYVHRRRPDQWRSVKFSEKMDDDKIDSSPMMAPAPITGPSEIDLEEGSDGKIQCRICLETDGRDFIAPCKCKGTSKYVHRRCLDHWRSVKEGYAFAHCTTCKASYYLKVQPFADRRWRTLKFRFFVTRDIVCIFVVIQLVIVLLAYLVYLIDDFQKFWLRLTWGFGSELSFYYICGAILFFALVGLSGCFITCFDPSVRNDPVQPVREVYICCCCCPPGRGGDSQMSRTLPIWTDYTICSESCCCCNASCECDCLGEANEAALPVAIIIAVVVICLFALLGIFYFILVATMVGQGIWQRHYHILVKRSLTKEYVVEDVAAGKMAGAEWSPPPLSPEHAQQLEALGLA